MTRPAIHLPQPSRWPLLAALLTTGAIVSALAGKYLPYSIDWETVFRPAALALSSGDSPYQVDEFFAAPWGLLALIPLAHLAHDFGRGAYFLLSAAAYAWVAYRLGAGPLALTAFMLSPPVLHGFLTGNIDWLVLLGLTFPPQIGLLFVMIKPQLGIGIAVFWLVQVWREAGWRGVCRDFWPLALVSLASLAVFGMWPARSLQLVADPKNFNMSLWPWGLPLGLTLLAASIFRKERRYAIACSPFLSPHVVFHSYAAVLAGILPSRRGTILACVSLWTWVAVRYLTTR